MAPRGGRGGSGGRVGSPGSGESGPRIDDGIEFEFRPSIGLSARRIDTFGLSIASFREPLKRSIQQVLAPSFRKNFEAGGRPTRWEPLSDVTVEMRGSAQPILVRSGLLKRTIQQFNIWTVDRTKAALLDLPQKIWYGKIHQAGYGSRGSGQTKAAGIPARPFVMVQDEDYEAIDRVFDRWFMERMAVSKAFEPGSRGRRR